MKLEDFHLAEQIVSEITRLKTHIIICRASDRVDLMEYGEDGFSRIDGIGIPARVEWCFSHDPKDEQDQNPSSLVETFATIEADPKTDALTKSFQKLAANYIEEQIKFCEERIAFLERKLDKI